MGRGADIACCAGLLAGLACDDVGPAEPTPSATPAAASVTGVVAARASTAVPEVPTLQPLGSAAVAGAKLLLDKADRQEDVRVRMRMAAGILEELEERRMPLGVVAALAAASETRVVAHQRAKIVWDGISQTPSVLAAWNDACHAGAFHDGGRLVVLLFAREKDPRKRSAAIFGMCRLEQNGLIGLDALTSDYDMVLLAHTVQSFLQLRGGVHAVEQRALKLLARGGLPPRRPFAADELPAVERPKRLIESAERALHSRIRAGVTLLRTGATKRFFAEMVHPHELGGVRLDDAAKMFSRKGKTKPLLEALELALERPARDDGEGEASVPLPWRPAPDARERLRFQLHNRVWYLRL